MTADEVGRLLSLISHEVRAPVGVMRGYLRLLEQQDAGLSEAHRQAVAAGLKAGDRATSLLAQISALARLYRGELTLSRRHLPLEPLLRSTIHEVPLPPAPIVTLHVGDTAPVALMADEELIRTAMAGLTSAVVRALAHDARVFLIAREEHRNDERGVAITIGAIEPVDTPYADGPLDLARGGLGLELPMAAFIVAAHGGGVEERREHERLAGVVVWLPVV
jgi:signal transduction histidine kinase